MFLLAILLSGCTSWLPEPHHIDIHQGNVIKQETRDQLSLGMTKSDVRALLGNAMLQDPFHPNRWDYIFSLRSDTRELPNSRLTLYFKDNELVEIDDKDFKSSE